MRRAVSKIIPGRMLPDTPLLSAFKIDQSAIQDFYVVLDDPHKAWLPGDEVSGQIILISKRNLANIVIKLLLLGYVKLNASSHLKLRPVKHSLFNHTIKIYGSGPQLADEEFSNGLFKGEHRFPFIVKLPKKRVFTSIDFGKGSIVYLLKAAIGNVAQETSSQGSDSSILSPALLITKTKHLKILSNLTITSEKLIQIVNPIDVAKLPTPVPKKLVIRDPRHNRKLSRTQSSTSTINSVNTFTTLSLNNSEREDDILHTHLSTPNATNNASAATTPSELPAPDSIRVSLDISKRGYLRGELIPVKLNINHLKKVQDLSGIIVTLVRVCRLDNGPEGLFESFRKDLQQLVLPLYVDPVTFKSEITTSVRVPADAFPTILGCPIVSFQYFIEVLVNLSGKPIAIEGAENSGPSEEPGFDGKSRNGTAANGASSVSDFKFSFNFHSGSAINQKERSGFVNTDKYKRMKKFLQLTTEVVIGTHRLEEHAENDESETFNQSMGNSVSPLSVRSLFLGSNGSPAVFSQPGLSPSHVPGPAMTTPNERPQTPNLHSIGGTLDNLSTPPYSQDEPQPGFGIPNYEEISGPSHGSGPVPIPDQSHLSEKDQMRAHEASLMPSEPPLDEMDEEDDDRETISPVNDNGLLENIDEAPEDDSQTDVGNSGVMGDPLGEDDLYHQSGYDVLNNLSSNEQENVDYVPTYEPMATDHVVESVPQTRQER